MPLTVAEKNTLASLIAESIQDELNLTNTQNLAAIALTKRNASREKVMRFMEADIPVSDAPAEVKPKRAYNRKYQL